jgi:hypothetical protein
MTDALVLDDYDDYCEFTPARGGGVGKPLGPTRAADRRCTTCQRMPTHWDNQNRFATPIRIPKGYRPYLET